ncbi:germination protein YpeB [Thermotalea metallivorans]|uniref:Sporulation protein YpeB n=1 Tax=Thermotalea metallivorans TaxID=520762 RepID=A0A140L6M4_9FIRM|nr:germination protein YpeB [Thermotalea metallivorans]KXG76199.1 Sporulation protein YpeB [Thermotalea metallivorans]
MKRTLPVILALALVLTGVWGYSQYREKNDYYIFLNNQFQRMYYDLMGSVESITSDLSKLMVSSQKRENMVLYANIWQNAYNAQEKMSQLPIRHADITKTEKFLSQVGDYTFTLAKRNIEGEPLSQQEVDNLEKLHNFALELTRDLHELEKSALKGFVWKGELRGKASKKLNREAEQKNPIQTKFQKFEERMVEYPELIYDGPFSEHVIAGMRPRLQGDKITEQQAREKVEAFIGQKKIGKVEKLTNGRGRIDTYSFEVVPENQKEGKGNPIYIDISQRKGYVVWILNNRAVEKKNISPKQAIKYASKFLEEKGFPNMVPTYTLRYDGTVLINYAYKQGDVLMYPDLIKVKVALDNGEIVGFDATHFLTTNYQRDIRKPQLTPAQAREKISVRAQVEGEPQLCIIPTDSYGEIYCYEFKATYKGDKFLIYINANTGEEEKILKTIENENGTLMI